MTKREVNKHKVCPRCKGRKIFDYVVVYAGVPGLCFECAGAGIVKTKLYEEYTSHLTFLKTAQEYVETVYDPELRCHLRELERSITQTEYPAYCSLTRMAKAEAVLAQIEEHRASYVRARKRVAEIEATVLFV